MQDCMKLLTSLTIITHSVTVPVGCRDCLSFGTVYHPRHCENQTKSEDSSGRM